MGLKNAVRSRGFRNFMAKLYGWGASVVILGALFKINHYQGADIMLIIGLGTESIIFFFSAFEPPYVEPDWSLVYPELAGLYHGDKDAQKITAKPTQQIDQMMREADIDQRVIDRFGEGLRMFGENAASMANISNASLVTNEYADNVKKASESITELSDNYKKTSQALNADAEASNEYVNNIKSASNSAAGLSDAYMQASEIIKSDMDATKEFAHTIKSATESAGSLNENYAKSAELIAKSVEALDFSALEGKSYNEQLKKISDNLAALNAVYELQLQNTNQQVESASKLQEAMNSFLENMNESSDKTAQYQNQLDLLTERVASLNKVYGNMLSAMSTNPNQG
ncbi:MAG: gliding motility protein GldL [Bacteroidales bacterium]|nr:gliding motility protein GldL [Bacteroidales bacterium]MCF8386300.1 gliding motility protein GldL [Bacteroidales bacterium]MCF8398177.1 gliding motility protein GldL [Bacteroidales bacterium]